MARTKGKTKTLLTRSLRKANPVKESGNRGNWGFGGVVRRFVRNSLKAFED